MALEIGKNELIRQLLATGCLKFGSFTLKSGTQSDYYIDLRESTMHPTLFQYIVELIKSIVINNKLNAEEDQMVAIVGVPYGVVPVAAALAYDLKLAYYPVRKEIKEYGNKTESSLLADHDYILVEDVMSSGSSILETIKKLPGKKITDIVVVVDRESGGEENLKSAFPHIRLHSILKASEVLEFYNQNK